MSLTVSQYIDRVRRLARQRGQSLDQADLESSLPLVLQLYGEDVRLRPDFLRLQVDLSFTLTSGVADLTTPANMMIESITRVSHPTLGVLSFLGPSANRSDLARPSLAPFYRYVIEANKLYPKHWDGTTDLANADLTVTANADPTVDVSDNIVIHASLEEGLVLKGYELASRPQAAAMG